MSNLVAINPRPFLSSLTGRKTLVKLKWGAQYVGILVASDAFMNLQLTQCYEYIDNAPTGHVGEVLIRCNNVLTIRSAEDGAPGVPTGAPTTSTTD